jgi:hypothetical protein
MACYDAIAMNRRRENRSNGSRMPDARRVQRTLGLRLKGAKTEKTFSAPGGQRNPLKRLDSDKEIQGNQSLFSWRNLAWAWPGFARLCWIWGEFGRSVAARGAIMQNPLAEQAVNN